MLNSFRCQFPVVPALTRSNQATADAGEEKKMNKYTMVMDYTLLSHDFLFSTNHEQPLFSSCWDRLIHNDKLINNFKCHFKEVLNMKEGDSDPAKWSLGYTPEDGDVIFCQDEYVYNVIESSHGLKFDALSSTGCHHMEFAWERTYGGDGIFGEGPYYSYYYRNTSLIEDRAIPINYREILHEDFNRRFVEKEFYAVKRKRW
jgi:hypothetical protein